eukprot:6475161-Amphidinium_carterae.1
MGIVELLDESRLCWEGAGFLCSSLAGCRSLFSCQWLKHRLPGAVGHAARDAFHDLAEDRTAEGANGMQPNLITFMTP